MKKIIKFLFSRMVIVGLLIAVQLAFIVVLILSLSEKWVYVFWGLQVASLFVVLWIISKTDNPSYKLAWCISILLLPLFGGLFYLMFGNKSLNKKLKTKIADYAYDQYHHFDENEKIHSELQEYNPLLYRQSEYITRISGFPACKNTEASYFPLGEDKWVVLLQELKKAKKFIFMEYFIVRQGKMWDPVYEILKQKSAEGVEVKFMYDDLGSIQTLPTGYDKIMRKAGIEVTVFNPFRPRLTSAMNYRDHRKITVIDGNVGFCGGINLADEYINAYEKHGHWKDTAVVLRGEAVRNLTLMFIHLWEFSNDISIDLDRYMPTERYESDGYIQPFGDSPIDDYNVAENAYMQMINCAKKYVYITSPYLILDNEMITALCLAAQSGIDVRIITPHIADKWYVHMVTQSYYAQLIQSGVKIYEYTPGFIHAKMFVCDDEIAIVGTTNMDYRSFYLHFECGVSFYRSSIVGEVKRDILNTIAISQEITLEASRGIKRRFRLTRSILRGFAPLM
ncbi:cardiolipin synthase [Hydrogenoanaerobacterium saccharovorans]|uniref:Cardiolipin synthase n=1 Tax=Hydrogenoanaerobacterium saccharovorans TaxID=474960 RepID=A0A1H8D2H2_9FIRM|nr:cardiolipin synthase [Hydrogenoanaerobacterium saccharovorans]RPF43428.1 cardiolipin synthase [Hydrogenoanaerobacterium saccharovorans]SEN00904.1 cardiolipin synthase [Hydrogenoanaerobacterium saccharovorans]